MKSANKAILTERLILLPGDNSRDGAAFRRLLQEGDFALFCGVEFSETALSAFDGYLDRPGFYAVYPRKGDFFIGYAGLAKQDGSMEIELYIGRKFRRQGYGREAVNALCRYAFAEEPRDAAETIYASTLRENSAAVGLLEACGFVRDTEVAFMMFCPVVPDGETGQKGQELIRFMLQKGFL